MWFGKNNLQRHYLSLRNVDLIKECKHFSQALSIIHSQSSTLQHYFILFYLLFYSFVAQQSFPAIMFGGFVCGDHLSIQNTQGGCGEDL